MCFVIVCSAVWDVCRRQLLLRTKGGDGPTSTGVRGTDLRRPLRPFSGGKCQETLPESLYMGKHHQFIA